MVFSEISRKQAFITHISVSMLIFFILVYLIVFQWYPSYYFFIDGGIRGILTIFFVDVVLGPGLTLFLFKPGKPGLKFDMSMVIVFQFCALVWGISNVYSERPSLTVFYNGKFNCLNQEDARKVDFSKFDQDKKPVLAVLYRPDHNEDYLNMMREAMSHGSSEIYYYGERFIPLNKASLQHVLQFELEINDKNMEILSEEDSVDLYLKTWQEYLSENPSAPDKYHFYPLDCHFGKSLAVFDPETFTIVDRINIFTKAAHAEINKDIDPMNIILDEYVRDITGF